MSEKLKEVWDFLTSKTTLGDIANVERGVLKDKDRPVGRCWACKKLATEAMTHESPGTAACCKGCDAYKGDGKLIEGVEE